MTEECVTLHLGSWVEDEVEWEMEDDSSAWLTDEVVSWKIEVHKSSNFWLRGSMLSDKFVFRSLIPSSKTERCLSKLPGSR